MSVDRNELILEIATEGFWDWDLETDRVYLSPRYCELVGYSPDDTIFDSHFLKSIIHPDDRSHVFNVREKYLQNKCDCFAIEYRMVSRDGTVRWIEGKDKIVAYNDQGDPVRMAGTILDITERKRVEEELRQNLTILQAALDCSPTGIAIANAPDGTLRYINDAGLQIRGDDRQAIVDGIGSNQYMSSCRFQSLDGMPLRTDEIPLVRAIQFGETCSKEFIICRTADEKCVVWATAAPIRDESDNVVAGIVVFSDITERKRAENEKAKLESQLRQAQKMEAVGHLAGGVAHDFNNMLGVILGHVELALAKSDQSQPIFNNLTEIRKASKRSAGLTRQLLAFARKQAIAPKVLDLNETVMGMLKMLQRLIGEDIHLNWHAEPDLWPIMIDPSQVDQILANLFINARDAISGVGIMTIETGNSSIDESCRAQHEYFIPGEYVRLAVSDDGCGMNKKTKSRIFDPFFTTKELGKGTGLGLATVYGIVKQNNGFINVYSEPEQGTTFTIYFPRYVGTSGQIRKEAVARPLLRGHETILLVDDEPAILRMTTMMLENQGYTVLAANTPDIAIQIAWEYASEISLLMTDMIMPVMNGLDLSKNLMPLYPHLKCLFMSGYSADVTVSRGMLDGGVCFIQKPFSIRDLAVKVREVLDNEV